jgi:hypothetical protein
VAGGWRRLHNEELHNLYSSTDNKLRRMRWEKDVARITEMKDEYKNVYRKT